MEIQELRLQFLIPVIGLFEKDCSARAGIRVSLLCWASHERHYAPRFDRPTGDFRMQSTAAV